MGKWSGGFVYYICKDVILFFYQFVYWGFICDLIYIDWGIGW